MHCSVTLLRWSGDGVWCCPTTVAQCTMHCTTQCAVWLYCNDPGVGAWWGHGRLTLLGRERKEEKGRCLFHHGGVLPLSNHHNPSFTMGGCCPLLNHVKPISTMGMWVCVCYPLFPHSVPSTHYGEYWSLSQNFNLWRPSSSFERDTN